MGERNLILMISLGVTACWFLVTMILGILAYTTEGAGIFPMNAGNVTDKYGTQFRPENWVAEFWYILIYVWTTLMLTYCLLNIFRTGRDGPIYCNPEIVSVEVCAAFCISWSFHILYLFLWANTNIIGSTIVLAILSIINWSCVVLFSVRLWTATHFLYHTSRTDLWCYRILVQNCLGTYAMWTTMEFFAKFGVALGYTEESLDRHPFPAAMSCIFVTFFISIWCSFELFTWDRYFRYMVTPLLVILFTMLCIYGRLKTETFMDETVQVYSLTLVCIAGPLAVIRLIVTVVKHIYYPLIKDV